MDSGGYAPLPDFLILDGGGGSIRFHPILGLIIPLNEGSDSPFKLSDAGCSAKAAEQIGSLYETGSYREMLHQMKVQRCTLIEQMHESQRKVDRMDFLIRNQEKQMK